METKSEGLFQALLNLIEIPWLIGLNLINHFWTLGLWLQEIRHFYGNRELRRADLLWMLEYGFRSPFALSRQATEGQHLPADLTVYGETPWTTLLRVCEALGFTAGDVFVDLGAGTGRNLLFLHYYFGARVIGYELVPRFVEKFSWLQHRLVLQNLAEIRSQNWFDADLQHSGGTVFFLVGSCYSDEHLSMATERLSHLPAGTRIATVSYPLAGDDFERFGEFSGVFSWGKGTVYLHRRT